MVWALFGHALNIIEQFLIANVIGAIDPFIYVCVFYVFSFVFSYIYRFCTTDKHAHKYKDRLIDHKKLVTGYVGGALLGNGFWFASLVILGLSLTSFVLVFIRVLVTLYAYLYMNDRFPADKAVALLVGFTALAVFSFSGGGGDLPGIAMAAISCFGFAMEAICRKKIVEQSVSFESFLTLRQFVLTAFAVLALLATYFVDLPGEKGMPDEFHPFAVIVFTAFIGGFLVHLIMAHAMRKIMISQNEALSTIKPVLLAVIGVVFLDENMSFVQAICGVVIVLSALYFLRPAPSKTPLIIPET